MTSLLSRSFRAFRTARFPDNSRRQIGTSVAVCSRGPQQVDDSEIEAADPFLSKLQKQTEASYLELLSRKEDVPRTEDEELAEQEEEQRCKERGEWGGPQGKEPTRFGDWEKGGRCSDF